MGFYQHRLSAVLLGKQLFQLRHLRQIVDHDVRVRRVLADKVLVIGLRRVERLAPLDCGHDGLIKRLRRIQLRDIRLGDALLLGIQRKDRRAVLRACIRALAVEFGGVVATEK